MTNLGMRSMFQSLFSPRLFGGVLSGLKIFHSAVRLREAPYPP